MGLSILELSTILVCKFWYNQVKTKYDERAKLCYADTDIAYKKTDHIYEVITNYELHRQLSKGKNDKVVRLTKDELGGKVMKKFVGWRTKDYSYLTNGGS